MLFWGHSSTARRRRRFLGAFWCREKILSIPPPLPNSKNVQKGGGLRALCTDIQTITVFACIVKLVNPFDDSFMMDFVGSVSDALVEGQW